MSNLLNASVLAATIAVFASSTGALAAPPLAKGAIPAASAIIKVHGGHRSCEWGPYGWHRHAGGRIACSPKARHPFRCWVGRYGMRHCWW